MRELRWVEGEMGCTDLTDQIGKILGYFASNKTGGWRGYVVDWTAGRPWSFREIADHPTEAAARAWVEDAVRRGQTGGSGVEGED